jgi:hypothetical protein
MKKYGKKIGQGMFTTAYLNQAGKVTLVTFDKIKECQANFGLGGSDLFPSLERIDYFYDNNDVFHLVLEMEYFPKVKSLKNELCAEDWALYQDLRKIFKNKPILKRGFEEYDYLYKQFEGLARGEELTEALCSCTNYTDSLGFEISPRNVAVKNGKLVLLDVFFCKNQFEEVWKRRKKKNIF